MAARGEEGSLVLVTGVTGFVAPHIVKLLLDKGYRVRGTTRSLKNENKVNAIKRVAKGHENNFELVAADLNNAECWKSAVSDCTYVIHTASPFPMREPKHPDDVIIPAVRGTKHVLKACAETPTIKRVVLTSSIAAVTGDLSNEKPYDENNWTDVNSNVSSYLKSKTLAEKEAWNFVKSSNVSFELAVINPGLVLGPVLHNTSSASIEIVKTLLAHKVPMLPKISMSVVDVRDVAKAHFLAMTQPEAAGKRHLLVNRTVWFKDIAEIIDQEFRSQGYKIPIKESPYALLKIKSFFDPNVKEFLTLYGKQSRVDNSRMINDLGINPIDLHATITDMCYSMIERGFVEKSSDYKIPNKYVAKSKL